MSKHRKVTRTRATRKVSMTEIIQLITVLAGLVHAVIQLFKLFI